METAIISGKGGTGKSGIAAAFATMPGPQVMLVDCDVDAANQFVLFNPSMDEEQAFSGARKAEVDPELCTNCGLCEYYCRFDAISSTPDFAVISEILCDGCQLCARICPHNAIMMIDHARSKLYSGSFRNGRMVYGRLAPGEENSGKLVNLVREKAKKEAQKHALHHLIIDGPPGIGCPVISTITGVDLLLVVTEPSLSGLSDLKRVLEVSQSFGTKTIVIINKFDLDTQLTADIEEFCNIAGISVIGKLPFDPQVVDAMVNCKSIVEWSPHSEISLELIRIWSDIQRKKL
ncbi:MAG: ATP-binding protein [Bacteroidales bacterium]